MREVGRGRRGGATGAPVNAALTVAVMGALAVMAACSSGEVPALRAPPTTQALESSTTTAAPAYDAVQLAGVGGKTRTTVVLGPGRAELRGTVVGPDGPVGGAVVHAERLVGDAAASTEVTTGPDGGWVVPRVLGGRFRVRAWRSPDLALLDPEVSFVEATESRQVGLKLSRFSGTAAASAIAPDPPVAGQPANLAFRVTQRTVDERGTVRTVPLARVSAQLLGSGQWIVDSPNPVITDGSGSAQWRLTCQAPGPQSLTVTVGAAQFPLTLPSCVPPAPAPVPFSPPVPPPGPGPPA